LPGNRSINGGRPNHGRYLRAVVITAAWLLVIGTLYAFETDSLEFLRRAASGPETVQALLGIAAGLMCRGFSGWMAAGKTATETDTLPNWAGDGSAPPSDTWRLLLFAGAFSAVVLSALGAPYARVLLDRMQRCETP